MITQHGIKNCIDTILRTGFAVANAPEPEYAAALAMNLPVELNALARQTGDKNFTFSGCFVHQKPYARFLTVNPKTRKRKCCELGDLMVLMREIGTAGEKYNCALFQLKKETTAKLNEVQFELYDRWPKFTVAKEMSKTAYDIRPKCNTPGALYMFIHETANPAILDVSKPFEHMPPCRMEFSEYLWQFMNWRTGRPIGNQGQYGHDSWTHLIWDLQRFIEKAPIRSVGGMAIGSGNCRITNPLCHYLGSERSCELGRICNEDFSDCEPFDRDPNEGFGVLLITRNQEKESKNE